MASQDLSGTIHSLFHCPFVDLSAQPLTGAYLEPGYGFPDDRALALVPDDWSFDASTPRNKIFPFERGVRHVGLQTFYNGVEKRFTISIKGNVVLDADLQTESGRSEVAAFFCRMYEWPEPVKIVKLPPGQLFAGAPISLISLSTVEEFGVRIGRTVDHMRFRANIYFNGWPAWSELKLQSGSVIEIGSVRLKVTEKTVRCRFTEINPDTAQRDLSIPQFLKKHYGHCDLGIYAEVFEAGHLSVGDVIRHV